jgi:hypothetical protein
LEYWDVGMLGLCDELWDSQDFFVIIQVHTESDLSDRYIRKLSY